MVLRKGVDGWRWSSSPAETKEVDGWEGEEAWMLWWADVSAFKLTSGLEVGEGALYGCEGRLRFGGRPGGMLVGDGESRVD